MHLSPLSHQPALSQPQGHIEDVISGPRGGTEGTHLLLRVHPPVATFLASVVTLSVQVATLQMTLFLWEVSSGETTLAPVETLPVLPLLWVAPTFWTKPLLQKIL